jgi:hypothetical protein
MLLKSYFFIFFPTASVLSDVYGAVSLYPEKKVKIWRKTGLALSIRRVRHRVVLHGKFQYKVQLRKKHVYSKPVDFVSQGLD